MPGAVLSREIEGRGGEPGTEPLPATALVHGDGSEEDGVAVRLENGAPEDAALRTRDERIAQVLANAIQRQARVDQQRNQAGGLVGPQAPDLDLRAHSFFRRRLRGRMRALTSWIWPAWYTSCATMP